MVDPINPAGTLGQLPQDNPLVQSAEQQRVPALMPPTAADTGRGGFPAPPTDQPGFGATMGSDPRNAAALMRAAAMNNQDALPSKSSAHVNAIGQGIQQAVAENPIAAAQPGGVMRAIVAGGLQGLMKHVGDAAAATQDVKAGQGALSGFAKAAAASSARQAEEQRTKFSQQQQLTEAQERKRMDDATIAHMQVETLRTQQLLRIAGNDEKEKAYDSDQHMLADFASAGVKAEANEMNDQELLQYQKNHANRPDGTPAHLIPIMDGLRKETDKDGNQFLRPTFSVYDGDGTATVGKDAGAEFDKYAPQTQKDADGKTLSWAGQSMPVMTYAAMKKKMDLAQAADAVIQKDFASIAKDKAEAEQFQQKLTDDKQRKQDLLDIGPALAHVGGSVLDLLDKNKAVIDAAEANPNNQQLQDKAKQAEDMSTKAIRAAGGEDQVAQLRQKREEMQLKAMTQSQSQVLAFNSKTNEMELTTKGNVVSNPDDYTKGFQPVKQTDVSKIEQQARQLNDAQMNQSRYKVASDAAANALSLNDTRALSNLMADDKFKAHFLGVELPVDWYNQVANASDVNQLSKPARDLLLGYLGERSAIIAYQRAITQGGRISPEAMKAELALIPDPLAKQDARNSFFERFQQNIDQAAEGIPRMPQIQRPKETRAQIEQQANAPAAPAPPPANKLPGKPPEASSLPPRAISEIKGRNGQSVTFTNGQTWKWEGGKPVFVGQK